MSSLLTIILAAFLTISILVIYAKNPFRKKTKGVSVKKN